MLYRPGFKSYYNQAEKDRNELDTRLFPTGETNVAGEPMVGSMVLNGVVSPFFPRHWSLVSTLIVVLLWLHDDLHGEDEADGETNYQTTAKSY